MLQDLPRTPSFEYQHQALQTFIGEAERGESYLEGEGRVAEKALSLVFSIFLGNTLWDRSMLRFDNEKMCRMSTAEPGASLMLVTNTDDVAYIFMVHGLEG